MSSPRILIVENESAIAIIIKEMLSNEGYCNTDIVATGKEAVTLALKARPDLILMDIKLSGKLDGIKAYEQIKNSVDIPVIFVSGFADEDVIVRASQSNPSGYIVKPFNSTQLIKEVEKALDWQRLPEDKRA
jgi:CheY-like chemotaxis protein